jgi:hypothetical protein
MRPWLPYLTETFQLYTERDRTKVPGPENDLRVPSIGFLAWSTPRTLVP